MGLSTEVFFDKVYLLINELLSDSSIRRPELANKLCIDKEELFSLLSFIERESYMSNIDFATGKGNRILIPFYERAQITDKGLGFLTDYQHKMTKQSKPTVFISYNQSTCSEFVDTLEKEIKELANVSRDNEKVGNWDSFREFMNSIREHDFAVIVLCDKYLKSVNCMYEVLQIMKENDWKSRIMTVVWNDVEIYNTEGRASYIAFWAEEFNKINDIVSELPPESTSEIANDLKQISFIKCNVGEFLQWVSQINNPNMFQAISAIIGRLKGKW